MSSPLLALAEGRWARIRAEQPSLSPALDLQRALLSRQIALLAPAFDRVSRGAPAPDELVNALAAGTPASARLWGEAANGYLDETFLQAFPAFLVDLGATAGRAAAARIDRAVTSAALDLPALLRAALQRDQDAGRALAAAHGVNLPVLWFAAELTTAPLAHAWQARVLGITPPDDRLREAVETWDRGSCPACGSWPSLAEFFHGQRLNRCAYCAATWPLASDRCTYCATRDDRFRTVVADRLRPGRRLELCRACGGYLKTLDVCQPSPFPLVAVEDLASNDLDRAALHHGYRRTPLNGHA